ncbi:MAG: hypothetical protein J6Y67_00940 [Lachnospiraceae bacterium]|nr:hypothetical protein [Lachnospiraceae bacterium]
MSIRLKRIVAVLLVMFMVSSLVPMQAIADGSTYGTGVAGTYLITVEPYGKGFAEYFDMTAQIGAGEVTYGNAEKSAFPLTAQYKRRGGNERQ